MDEATNKKTLKVMEERLDHRRQIADDLDMTPEEKLEADRAGQDVALGLQRRIATEWNASLDRREEELEQLLYHGGKDYKAAIREAASKDDRGLEELARIASRTGDDTLARAAAVVARERGNNQLFHDYYIHSGNDFAQAYRELLEIPDPDERRVWANQFAVRDADAGDLRPSREAVEARERRLQQERVSQTERPGSILGRRILG